MKKDTGSNNNTKTTTNHKKKHFNNFTTISAKYYSNVLKEKKPLVDMVGLKYKNILNQGEKIVKKQKPINLKHYKNKPMNKNEMSNLYEEKFFSPPLMSDEIQPKTIVRGENTGYLAPLSIIDPKKRPNLKSKQSKVSVENKKIEKVSTEQKTYKQNEKLTKSELLKLIEQKNKMDDNNYIKNISKNNKNKMGKKVNTPSLSTHEKLKQNLKIENLSNFNKKWNS
ncbi:hypothetical protein [Spiroplasma endosymbiont of Amphibalanus improvisus]|uniref:hypothetical protein n=1 Tax=Spiroplasma endosymbiont of Amphibalanus improvisus TaxID=3066327 RepID=UPI00313D8809